ncbi:MAG: discoidin domain-containing protein, partial [Magnetococcales bacterium]|nr:discoidin domain-containing protein [Magnetococcales bacterium]
NGTSDAHNYYSSSYGPGKAFDNSSSSFWGSWPTPDPGPPYWIKYSFTSAVYVREVVITNRNDPSLTNYAPASFKLQGSNDNTTWYTVAEWTGVSFGQGETKTFRPTVYAKNQNRMPYGLLVEAYNALPYAAQVSAAQSQPFDMPPLIVAQQVTTPFALTMATGQGHLFDMPPLLVANQVAMPFGTLLAVQINQLYECADLIRQWSLPYDLTTRAASSLAQPFGVAVAGGLASPYALAVAASLTTGYAWTVEKSLEQPYASQVVAGCGQTYGLELAVQNEQSFAILFAANACAQPCPIQLEVYHVQPWQMPVAQANTQPLYDTVCKAGRQPWSTLWPVAQANGQSFDRTITVVASHCQPHDLLERNPVVRALSGSWDLSAARPSMHIQGGVRAFHLGVSL